MSLLPLEHAPGSGYRGVILCSGYAIYYYTPLPLKLANKQQASNKQASKQALLLSVLAIARPHRSGLYSTLAILEPIYIFIYIS